MDSSEPMTLGSPLNTSGHSPQNFQSSKMLPGFLIGDTSLPAKSPVGSLYFSSPLQRDHASPLFRQTMQSNNVSANFSNQNKSSAPPVKSLADDFESHKASPRMTANLHQTPPTRQRNTPGRVHFSTPNMSGIGTPRGGKTLGLNRQVLNVQASPTQVDPFYTQGEALTSETQLDDTWVTIFGFPNLSASYVLQKFSHHGTIICHKIAGAEGNYMHVKYESSLQAKKALSRNGKILPGNIMIGVTPCIDLSVISNDEENSIRMNNTSITSPRTPGNLKQSIRPLTSAYRAASNENKVVHATNTPQKSSGILTKAMDFMFG